MRKFLLFFLMLTCSVWGSATMMSSDTQIIYFASSPSGAQIRILGMGATCITPCEVKIKNSLVPIEVEVSARGYKEEIYVLSPRVNKDAWWNLIGFVGFTTDALTGAMWEYNPNSFYFELEGR